MIKPLQKYRSASIVLLFVLLTQACAQVRLDAPPALPTARDIEPITTEERTDPRATSTAQVEITTATEIIPTPTSSLPKVTISAVKGNIFIRRGPDMAFNQWRDKIPARIHSRRMARSRISEELHLSSNVCHAQ
jgi:hypothetical protein